MPVTYKKTVAVLEGTCTVEEAEPLLAWLIETPKGRVNLKACLAPHTAVVQVLMALKPAVSVWPDPTAKNGWLNKLPIKPA